MTLEVLICSYGAEGIDRVAHMELPKVENVSYLVSLQLPVEESMPMYETLDREDIKISVVHSRGLSVNRNHALEVASGDLLLIADDDLHYTAESLSAVINIFEDNPGLDFAAFRHEGGDDKWFPTHEFDFANPEPKGYYLTSFELAMRRRCLSSETRFPENMGVGTDCFQSGEESVFLWLLRRFKLNGRYYPVTVAWHPGQTTGTRSATPGILRGQGAYLRLRYGGVMGFLRLLRDVPRRNAPVLFSLRYLFSGFKRANEVFNSVKQD